MFTNERLFTIQAFTITRVHCTYIIEFIKRKRNSYFFERKTVREFLAWGMP